MKKIVLKSVLAGLAAVALPLAVLAYTSPPEPGGGNTDIGALIGNIVGKVWQVFAGLAVILFVWAGVKFLTAGGSAEKIAEARTAALWGVVGVVVMVLAFSIFNIATSLIG